MTSQKEDGKGKRGKGEGKDKKQLAGGQKVGSGKKTRFGGGEQKKTKRL